MKVRLKADTEIYGWMHKAGEILDVGIEKGMPEPDWTDGVSSIWTSSSGGNFCKGYTGACDVQSAEGQVINGETEPKKSADRYSLLLGHGSYHYFELDEVEELENHSW